MSRSITINEGTRMLVLPDGEAYTRLAGEDAIDVVLTDEQWARVRASAVSGGFITDNGAVSDSPASDIAVDSSGFSTLAGDTLDVILGEIDTALTS